MPAWVVNTTKCPLLCRILHGLPLGQQATEKAGIQRVSGCLMLQSWSIHSKCEQQAAIVVSRPELGCKINQLCVSEIKIASVVKRQSRRHEQSSAKEQGLTYLAGKFVWAEVPCSFKAATSHALAAALSWLNMPKKCSPSCSNTAPFEPVATL